MAERYTLFEIDKLRDRFHLTNGVPAGVHKSYNIAPTQLGSVIVNRGGVNVLEQMKWGFVPAGAKDTNSVFRYKTFLAKSEGIFSKPTWADAIRHSRCLIPANGFYEWQQTTDGKLPFYVRPTDQDLFAFAGIYSSWTDLSGTTYGTYAIVTTQYDRYPKKPLQRAIILNPADEAQWLDPTISDVSTLYGIMRPTSDDMLHIHQVSPDVKNIKANSERLILPIS
jgi:putative SOS response-associated peptidase YedK